MASRRRAGRGGELAPGAVCHFFCGPLGGWRVALGSSRLAQSLSKKSPWARRSTRGGASHSDASPRRPAERDGRDSDRVRVTSRVGRSNIPGFSPLSRSSGLRLLRAAACSAAARQAPAQGAVQLGARGGARGRALGWRGRGAFVGRPLLGQVALLRKTGAHPRRRVCRENHPEVTELFAQVRELQGPTVALHRDARVPVESVVQRQLPPCRR